VQEFKSTRGQKHKRSIVKEYKGSRVKLKSNCGKRENGKGERSKGKKITKTKRRQIYLRLLYF
jgi:hypothetical protein